MSQAMRVSPGILGTALALGALVAVLPAAQVLIVDRLAHHWESQGARATGIVLLGLVSGTVLVAQEVSNTLQRMAKDRISAKLSDEFDLSLTGLPLNSWTDQSTSVSARQARDAIKESIAPQSVSAVRVLMTLLTVISLCTVIARIDLVAAGFVVGSLVPTLVAFAIYSRLEDKLWPVAIEHDKRSEYFQDQLVYQRSAVEIASLGAGGRFASLAAASRRKWLGTRMTLERASVISDAACGVASSAFIIAALVALSASGAGIGAITGGVLGILTATTAVAGLGYTLGSMMTALPAIDAYRTFQGSIPESDSGLPAVKAETLLVRGVVVRYDKDSEFALRSLDLTVNRGQMIAIVGANGAGKSTLVNAIVGLIKPDEGIISVDGKDLSTLNDQERLRYFGVVAQDFGRYETSVRTNVEMGMAGASTDPAVWDALKAAEAAQFVEALPIGLDTELGVQWGGTGLSGGQWQRLALARLAHRDAGIWLLDEPTSAIDAVTEEEIFSTLKATAGDRITIVVSHRAWTLRQMDQIYVMKDGAFVESGTFSELAANPTSAFSIMFKNQRMGDSEQPNPNAS